MDLNSASHDLSSNLPPVTWETEGARWQSVAYQRGRLPMARAVNGGILHMKHLKTAALSFLGLLIASPAMANDRGEMVTASNPAGIVVAMLNAGHNPELTTDRVGDPLIISRGPGANLVVYFFGCDATTHDRCQSIRLQVGYDRAKPWTAQEAMKLSDEFPFLAVRLDQEGDPYVHWDLVLGDGIPVPTFVKNLRAFEESVTLAADLVYAEEKAEQAKGQ